MRVFDCLWQCHANPLFMGSQLADNFSDKACHSSSLFSVRVVLNNIQIEADVRTDVHYLYSNIN